MDIVMYLLDNGAIPSAEDERGKSAKDVSTLPEIAEHIKQQEKQQYIALRFVLPAKSFASQLANRQEK